MFLKSLIFLCLISIKCNLMWFFYNEINHFLRLRFYYLLFIITFSYQ